MRPFGKGKPQYLCQWGRAGGALVQADVFYGDIPQCGEGQRWAEGRASSPCLCLRVLGAAEHLFLIYLLLRLFVLVLGCWQLCKLR